jgi:transcriptional regulator GlxA family with amidase domain
LDLTGPHEVFDAANRVADDLGRSGPRYRQRILAPTGTDVTSESGLRIGCDPLTAAPADIGTLVLPGGDGVHEAATDETLLCFAGEAGRRADRLATVCTGAFLAAAAGLLDGCRVATHWARAARLQRCHPTLDVDAESLHHRDGRVWSSAGVTAGMDLALAMVEHDHDAEVAQITARWLVLHLRRPGGQSQFAAPVWSRPSALPPVRQAMERIESSPGEVHTVAELATVVGLSPRHFSRLFTAEVGESPARFVDRVRVEAARRELETSDVGLTSVARQCGFGSTETMRRAFHRRLGVAPDDYRRRFRIG